MTRIVGKAIHEVALTSALRRSSKRLLPPGPGRSVIVIPEVAIGRGRPDVLVVVVSMTALNAYMGSGLRVATVAEARALVTFAASGAPQMANSHDLPKTVGRPWTRTSIRRYSMAVVDSLAIEAKMKDWKQAIRQASRFRHLAHRAAIMLPESGALGRSEPYLHTYDLGFISLARHRPDWRVGANKSDLHPGHALWLLELAARETRAKYPPLL